MSWKAAGKVKELTENLSRSEKLLLLVIADYHNDATGRCDPSISRLAVEALMSPRTAYRALARLKDKGFLEIQARQGRSNQYALLCLDPSHGVTPDKTSPLTLVTQTPDIAVSPKPKEPQRDSNRRRPAPQASSDRAPAAPKSVPLKTRFLKAEAVPARVAVVVDLFAENGVELTAKQKAHLGAFLKKRGHGMPVWRAVLAATTAEGDPIEMMQGGMRNGKSRSSSGRGTRVVIAADVAAARDDF